MNYKVPFIDYPTHYHRLEAEIDAAIANPGTAGLRPEFLRGL